MRLATFTMFCVKLYAAVKVADDNYVIVNMLVRSMDEIGELFNVRFAGPCSYKRKAAIVDTNRNKVTEFVLFPIKLFKFEGRIE